MYLILDYYKNSSFIKIYFYLKLRKKKFINIYIYKYLCIFIFKVLEVFVTFFFDQML